VSDTSDGGKPAVPVQPEISFRPTEQDEFFIKFGFAAGNGLNNKSPFALTVWAADLEDDVKDINGRNRDYLLTAWYKHTFQFRETHTLGLSWGLVDSTDYLGENTFANDEYTQFLNEAFVNARTRNAPSYDIGGALQWAYGNFSVNGVIMDVGKNDDDNNYQFYGVQLGYTLNSSLGEGNYRVIMDVTSQDFLNPDGEEKEQLAAATLSFDQQLGDIIGAFLRVGMQMMTLP
jgi:porin